MQPSNNKRKREDAKSAPGASQASSSAPRGHGVVATSRGRGVAPETPAGHPHRGGWGVVAQVPRGTAVGRGRGCGVGRGRTMGVWGGHTASTQRDDTQLLRHLQRRLSVLSQALDLSSHQQRSQLKSLTWVLLLSTRSGMSVEANKEEYDENYDLRSSCG
ncbi:hypothetical protein FRC03_000290 [Tulasnella sp. 419]|nr:hypothetical protein FRC03_000290 [Tulasnella sp. 419]